MKKWPFFLAALLCIIVGICFASKTNTVDIINLSEYVFDESGNLYLLSSNKSGENLLTKTNKNGEIIFQKKLKSEENGLQYKYDQMDIDNQGNLCILIYEVSTVKDEKNNDVVYYKKEKISMYNSLGEYTKDIALVDWSNNKEVITKPYIFKFQIKGSNVNFFTCKDSTWEQYQIDVNSNEQPMLIQKFKLVDSKGSFKERDWITNKSIAVTADNRICYQSRDGYFYIMDQNKQFRLLENKFTYPISSISIEMDDLDNIYVLDSLSGSLYLYNPKTGVFSELYKMNSNVIEGNSDILLCDVFDVEICNFAGRQTFCAITKDGGSYIEFGDDTLLIDNIKRPFFPLVSIKALGIAIVLFGVFAFIRVLIYLARKRLPLIVKIFLLFMPVFLISLTVLLLVVYGQIYSDYREVKLTSQSSVSNHLAHHIDGDKLDNITFSNYYEEREELMQNLDDEVEYMRLLYKDSIDCINMYSVKNNDIYMLKRYNISKKYLGNQYRNSVDDLFIYHISPKEQLSGDQKLYNLLVDMKYSSNPVSVFDSDISVYDRVINDSSGEWVGVVYPITNSSGEVVGMIENLLNTNRYVDVFKDTLVLILALALVIVVVIFFYLLLVLKITFAPLVRLQKCVASIGDGVWDVKVKVTTHDEIGDVSTAFNLMCDRINQYISSLMALNKTSLRFLPKDLFQIMGKNKITDVSLYDMVEKECHTILADFYYGKDDYGPENISQKKYFNKMNNNFNAIYKVVSRNGGIIETYDGRGMLIIFPNKAEDAMNAALQLRDIFSIEKKYGKVKVILGTGNMLIGVAGNEARCSMTVLSDTVLASYYINGQIDKIGIQGIITQQMIDNLSDKSNFNYRYIGKSHRFFKNDTINIYEIIDDKNVYSKNLYLSTKSLFEFGVKSYINADFYNARRSFLNVLGINEKDKVAMYYLTLCNENENMKFDNWEGCIF